MYCACGGATHNSFDLPNNVTEGSTLYLTTTQHSILKLFLQLLSQYMPQAEEVTNKPAYAAD